MVSVCGLTSDLGYIRCSRTTRESGRETGANRTFLPAIVTSPMPAARARARNRATSSSDTTTIGRSPYRSFSSSSMASTSSSERTSASRL